MQYTQISQIQKRLIPNRINNALLLSVKTKRQGLYLNHRILRVQKCTPLFILDIHFQKHERVRKSLSLSPQKDSSLSLILVIHAFMNIQPSDISRLLSLTQHTLSAILHLLLLSKLSLDKTYATNFSHNYLRSSTVYSCTLRSKMFVLSFFFYSSHLEY